MSFPERSWMPQTRSSLHEWINSAGIIITFGVAGFSAWLSWTTLQLKNEDLFTFSEPTGDCVASYYHQERDAEAIIDTCWIVTIANKSDDRLSIIDTKVLGPVKQGDGYVQRPIFAGGVHNPDGSVPEFPVMVDAGGACRFLVYTPINVPGAVAEIIEDIPR